MERTVPHAGVTVERGMTHDGLGKYISEVVEKAPGDTDPVAEILRMNHQVVQRKLQAGRSPATACSIS